MLNPKTSFYRFSLLIIIALAAGVAPFASSAPDGLERVAQDLRFEKSAQANPPHLPLSRVWADYRVRGLPPHWGNAVAGVLGVAITFAGAWGLGKGLALVQKSAPSSSKH
jgi:cobalt/nickel transport protein